MRILSSIVQSLVRAVLDARHHLRLCSRIGTQLVGHHHARGETLVLEKLALETHGGWLVPSALQQAIEDVAVRIDGAPQPVLLPLDRHHHLVEVPFVGKVAS